MAKSTYRFNRWKAQAPTTWAYTVFRKYDLELTRIGAAQFTASKFIYKALGSSGAQWQDKPTEKIGFHKDESNRYADISAWSEEYKSFDNWTNLNSLLTLSSNFETYLASVIRLSLVSDPGTLLGFPRSIDGIQMLKHEIKRKLPDSEVVMACTKGDWSSRLNAFFQMFGDLEDFKKAHADLEFIRTVRNEIGHAFGRDIDEARLHGQITTIPIRHLSHERFRKLQLLLRNLSQSIDQLLMGNHIGEYEIIEFYSKLEKNHTNKNASQRAMILKKAIGQYGGIPRGKLFCNDLINYWDEL